MRIGIATAALSCLGLGVLLNRMHMDGLLLRADPATLPLVPNLMAFALRSGPRLYASSCASCHGQQGKGSTSRGVPDLTDEDWLYGSGTVADIEQVIEYGIRSHHPKAWNLAEMPAFGTATPSRRDPAMPPLTPGDIRDVVELLLFQEGREAEAQPDAVARGAAIFSGRGGCYDCHGHDSRGDAAIGAPSLADHTNLYGDGSREWLTLSVTYGRQGICPAFIDRIKPADVRKIAVFVYSLSHNRKARTDAK